MSTSPTVKPSRAPAWAAALALALVTLAVYWPATQAALLNFDDDVYITANPRLAQGLTWENGVWFFTHPYFSNWHPLTMLSYLLDYEVWGPDAFGFHLTNIVFHALNTALVFWVLRRLTGAFWRCVLVAALFGLHPLHVESVAWVAERKDVLSGFFFLLTLLAYARYAQSQPQSHRATEANSEGNLQPSTFNPQPPVGGVASAMSPVTRHASRYYWLAVVFFALGLMCKPMLVTLPCVLLLLDFWPLRRFPLSAFRFPLSGLRSPVSGFRFPLWRRLLVEKIPFFTLALASCIVTSAVQQESGAVVTMADHPFSDRVGNALVSYLRYLGQTFWPVDLAIFYPHPGAWPMELVMLAAAGLGGITWFCFWRWRQQPYLLVGWLWFLGMLVPVIGLVQAGKQALADRYTYLPLLGVFIALAWAMAGCRNRKPETGDRQAEGGKQQVESGGAAAPPCLLLAAVGVVAVILCALLTWRQLGHWRNSETIFRHTLAVTKDNAIIQYNLGTTLGGKGQTDEAIEHFQEAIRIKPNYAGARNNLAVMLVDLGRLPEAVLQYQEAIRLTPDDGNTRFNLGAAYYRQGRLDAALEQFQAAARLSSGDAEIQARLKVATELQRVIGLATNDPATLNNTAWELATSPNPAIRSGGLAVPLAERACELTQHRVTVMLGTLAAAYAEAGRFDEAVATAQKAIALATERGETQLLQRNAELLKRYQSRQPYHER